MLSLSLSLKHTRTRTLHLDTCTPIPLLTPQFECTSNISNAIKLVDRMQHEGLTIDQRTLRMLTKACRQPGNTQHWRQLQNLRRRHQEDLWGGKWGVKHGGGDSGGGGGEGGGYKETSSLHSA